MISERNDPKDAQGEEQAAGQQHGSPNEPHSETISSNELKAKPDTESHGGNSNQNKHWTDYATTGFAFLAVIVSAISASFAYRLGDIASRNLIASNRPWISIDPIIASDVTWPEEGARITIKFKLKNIGHAPADIVVPITSSIYLMTPGHMDPAGRQKQLCAAPKFPYRGPFGFTIFPDETDDSEANIELIVRKDIDTAFYRNNGQTVEITPTLVGCVKYRYMLDDEHQTGFIRMLSWINPAQPSRLSGFDPTKGTVPMAQIRFDKTIAPGFAN